MKNFAIVLMMCLACLFGGAAIQKARTPETLTKHEAVVGGAHRCPCNPCKCESCDCNDKEASFIEIRKQLAQVDRDQCCDSQTVLVYRPWLDWAVGYQK